ncbi:MAG: rRNA pseudouridine synthase, partial [Sphingobacteriales bacterium]
TGGERPKRSYGDRKPDDRAKRPYGTREEKDGERPKRPYGTRDNGDSDRPKRAYGSRDDKGGEDRPKRSYGGDAGGDRPKRSFKPGEGTPKPYDKDRKPYRKAEDSRERPARRPREDDGGGEEQGTKKPYVRRTRPEGEEAENSDDELSPRAKRGHRTRQEAEEEDQLFLKKESKAKAIDTPMTLNKYIAHSGECSRRDAAEFVKQGKVRVNGELVLEPGYRVVPGDQVTLSGKKLTPQKGLVYILLNKPKGFITTTDDPEDRKTIMDLVANAEVERLFPVGRLDRNTTGLILLTNDGNLAHKLAHPSYNINKVYQVTLEDERKWYVVHVDASGHCSLASKLNKTKD